MVSFTKTYSIGLIDAGNRKKKKLFFFSASNIGIVVGKSFQSFSVSFLGNSMFQPLSVTGKHFFFSRSLFNLFLDLIDKFYASLASGYYSELMIVGIGYRFFRFSRLTNTLGLNLGYSHYIYHTFPSSASFRDFKTYLFIYGSNAHEVKYLARFVRSYRIPDSYKGKGIKYLFERPRLKSGKQRQK